MVSRLTITIAVLTLGFLAESEEARATTLFVSDLGNYPTTPASGGVLAFSTTGSPIPPTPFASGFATEGVTCLLVNGVTELFVADITNDLVHVYNASTGALIMNINPGGQPNGGISLSPDGSTLYVPVNLDKLVAINASTGVVEDSSATVAYTHDAAVNPSNGMVYSQVISGAGVAIVEYSPDLTTETTFLSTVTTATIGLGFATGLTFDGSGNLWLADYQANEVFEYNPAGNLLRTITSSTYLNSTFDLALGPDGNMYATDFGNNSVTEIDVVDGTYALSTFISNAGSKPKYLEFTSDCCSATPEPSSLMTFTPVALFGLVVWFHRRNTACVQQLREAHRGLP